MPIRLPEVGCRLKCTKFIFHGRPGYARWEAPHTLVGWDLGHRGAAGRTFAPGSTDLHAATAGEFHCLLVGVRVGLFLLPHDARCDFSKS